MHMHYPMLFIYNFYQNNFQIYNHEHIRHNQQLEFSFLIPIYVNIKIKLNFTSFLI